MIDERHSIVNGHLLIEFVAEEAMYLGKMWYPWPTNGLPLYTDMVLIPDLLEGIGDSTLRITRFLIQMRNTRFNQTTDFLNNILRPLIKVKGTDNYTDDDLKRTGFGRILSVDSMEDVMPMQEPVFPPEAFEDQAQLVRETQTAEPAMQDFQPGSEAAPMAGKTATTAVLQSRSADAITADELSGVSLFVHDTAQVWLALDQHAMEEPLQIPFGATKRTDQTLFPGVNASAMSEGEMPKPITIDPMDIQEEFEIVPEDGSTLADNDDYVMSKLQQAFGLGERHPDIFDLRYLGQEVMSRVPGIDMSKVMAPPPQAPPPPPPRVGINIQAKLEDQTPDVQTWVLEQMGAPHEGTAVLKTIQHAADAIGHVARAANSAADLESPANPGGANGAPSNASGPDSTAGIRNPKGLGSSKR
jgi:hypothetical protein